VPLRDSTLRKLRTLHAILNAVTEGLAVTLPEGSDMRPANDWRYLQSYLAPEVLLHLSVSGMNRPEYVVNVPGFIVIADTGDAMIAKAVIIKEWLDSTGNPSGHGEALTAIREAIPSRIKSHDGRQKARRLLDQLSEMLSEPP